MRKILVVALAVICLGCTSLDVRKSLEDVESYIMERPDSALAGVPCLCVGINRMQKTVGHYNETQLTLGPTSSGFGLALKF